MEEDLDLISVESFLEFRVDHVPELEGLGVRRVVSSQEEAQSQQLRHIMSLLEEKELFIFVYHCVG
eukprot:CAMPEP_0170556428 /NCGR_PEP_ID=MMETSP0211-20121228/16816_1 /TAXON_ID=311385 /ORGANISM="Pseudokeronopsis sp., Strain OXSARD2" /LENGTH=65 /DNA_ID=CAMNT_0010866757 /DNA_START=335 /DNA_END=532 /DNA_ORIENTATION=+